MPQLQLPRKTVETLHRLVILSDIVSHLTQTGAAVSKPFTSHDSQPNLSATIQLCLTAPVIYCIALEQRLDASAAGYVGPTALPFCRVFH